MAGDRWSASRRCPDQFDTLELKTQKATDQLGLFGLSFEQVKKLTNSFADGFVGVFDSLAQAIANGENAVKAMGKAFLQFAADFLRQIATMILKQIILNALQSFGGGGNPIAAAATALIGTAHTGGVIGFEPNEELIVGKIGEEVITEGDPRHRNNGGLSKSDQKRDMDVRIVNVLNEASAANFLSSAGGQKVIVSVVRQNAGAIKSILGK